MKEQAKKFIVWDWNGTLIEDLSLNHQCFNATLAHSGKQVIGLDRYQHTFDVPIEKLYLNNGFTSDELARLFPVLQNVFHTEYNQGILVVDFREGAREILRMAQAMSIQNIILSNHLVPSIEDHLDRLDARDLFVSILAHETIKSQASWMPKGKRLEDFMMKHGLEPDNGIIIGDTIEEIHIGRELGLLSIALANGFCSTARLEQEAPNHLIYSLKELRPILHSQEGSP